ncbi:endoplasmic reticulum metallopeptidase 1, partial [Eurosta solidaginis]|uniref:endoplasmic reticulum metallopeptidase 1 n=1 Tax=Eurosta solidaginis TaxID=178769 RepID=UPI0035312627
ITVIPSFYQYPETLNIFDEISHADQFIGGRCQMQLFKLSNIGVKVVGSVENEILAVSFLLEEIEKVKAEARLDLYDIEVEVQHATGEFALFGSATSYQNITNVVVKLAPKNVTRATSLLINAHFDSAPSSPGAGDDGVMIAIMLETLRVISRSEKQLRNSIVFLFNGAEESGLLASHGFITSHRWALDCKAFINLDSAGSGGRDIIFQSGPNHPWLMKYYKSSAPHPHGNTIAEELFQNDVMPADTDYRIFRDYGMLPGLDMAHTLNGYVYHTKFDNFQTLQPRTCQTTGENVLALAWSLANAPELENPQDYAEGTTVFYDYLGWFMISYTENNGILINIATSAVALIVITTSIVIMPPEMDSKTSLSNFVRFFIIFVVQLVSILLAVAVTFWIAYTIDGMGASECWYSQTWLIFGLYFCPMFFVMCFLPSLYIGWTKVDTKMPLNQTIACFMHSHGIIMVALCLGMTAMGLRSAYLPMVGILFYTISVILNILGKECFYIPIHLLCQLLPFCFYTYLTYVFLTMFIPFQARSGPARSPEILISIICIVASIHFGGFILPVLHKFHKSMSFVNIFAVLCLAFIMLANLPIGFPYKQEVSTQRAYITHSSRTWYDEGGKIYRNDSGFDIQVLDRRIDILQNAVLNNFEANAIPTEACTPDVCWMVSATGRWIQASSPSLPMTTELILNSKKFTTNTRIRYDFGLKVADRSVIYVVTYPGMRVVDWSFSTAILRNDSGPYLVNRIYAMVEEPLQFWVEVDTGLTNHEGATLRLGVGSYFFHDEAFYTNELREFLGKFPKWSCPISWFISFVTRDF